MLVDTTKRSLSQRIAGNQRCYPDIKCYYTENINFMIDKAGSEHAKYKTQNGGRSAVPRSGPNTQPISLAIRLARA